MWAPSRGSSSGSGRRTWRRRIADYLADDQTDVSDNESFITAHSDEHAAPASGAGGMLPAFLADQGDLVEVMLELDEESMVVRSVTPTAAALCGPTSLPLPGARSLSRCSSTSSRIRRKFAWLRSPSPRPPAATAASDQQVVVREAALAARERRRAQARLDRSRSGARRALKGLRFISRTTGSSDADAGAGAGLWRGVEERFNALATDGLLARDDFGDCIGMVDSKEFAVGIFDALARRRRQNLERISKDELYEFWLQISDQSFDARLQIFFDMVDTNVDGRITREEVQELIVLSASANKLSKLKEQAEEYASLIMEELDPENLGYIELWQLEALLLQRDAYMTYSRPMSSGSAAQWSQGLSGGAGAGGQPSAQQQQGVASRWRRWSPRRAAARARVAAAESWRRAWVLALWVAAMAALFAWRFVQYRRSAAFRVMGYCLPTAKGAAETLKLNMALVLLPVCRNTLTWLRSTWARFFVPFDDSIAFHKIIATAIALGICLHAGNHLACDFPRLIASAPEEYRLVARFFGRDRPSYRGLLAGAEGVTGIVMVTLMAVSFTLATRPFRKREEASRDKKKAAACACRGVPLAGFNAFWYSHHLLIVVYLLLLVHGWFMFLVDKWYQRTTWMYISVPLALYVGERTLRAFRSKAYAVKILKVCLLPGNVLTVTMSKPYGFRYRSGQYIFLQCPTISPFEWHPFSITSAPGDDCVSVHVQTRGDWTQELKRIFVENYFTPCVPRRAAFGDLGAVDHKTKSPPRLLVDGPYGAPAQDFRNYDVLLLVGLGIGATPFISILRDLLNNIKLADELMDLAMETGRAEDSASNLSASTASGGGNKRRAYRTTCAHFYWVTREPGSFEWFKGVMNEVAEMDNKGVIELHNYLTSVYEERDARTTLLSMVQALNHAKHGVDIVSGTRVRTHFARPNWKEVFTRIASKHPNSTVGVFYCGRPTLAKELKKLSLDMSHRTGTRFDFHKEYF
ncbi:respiratory burst oxidase homolog protein E [Zea mays]|uniref:Riboflavin synthase-like superfamily protein n=1 Tax=Zea mays TaxID=4577 RepID=A0A1D6KNE5_MAIZE|nr:respiratory burst oxidase homolog protein E [Zea mays]ONM04340.1 Riboflavin synthase-like superfamily protein [Zea mays]|eukprot:XP_008664615.1 respiratory burst oxidase homolog protein E [Zea mays]